jgi:hypothetical protein
MVKYLSIIDVNPGLLSGQKIFAPFLRHETGWGLMGRKSEN